MGKQIDPAFLGNVVILSHKGFTVANIASALDTTYARVRGAMEVYGIKVNKKYPSNMRVWKEVREAVASGLSRAQAVKQVTDAHGMKRDTVDAIARKFGI